MGKLSSYTLLCLLLAVLLAVPAGAATYVNRSYYYSEGDHQWHYNIVDVTIGPGQAQTWGTDTDFGMQGRGTPYILEADVYTAYDNGTGQTGTLNIGPGVTVQVPPQRGIYSMGTLNAQGTSTSHILFTSTGGTSQGSWDEIMLVGSGASGSVLRYCDVQYAGRPENKYQMGFWHNAAGGIHVYSSAPAIDHCTVSTCNQGFRGTGDCQATITNSSFTGCDWGVALSDSSYHQPFGTTLPIRNNTISGNAHGTYSSAQAAGAFDASNTVTSNTYNVCRIYSGDIQNAATWANMNGSPVWQITDGLVQVPEGKTLNIAPGNRVKMGATRSIYVFGTLTANGTQAKPITFTSIRDDSVGGDTNEDGAATFPARGDWGSVIMAWGGSSMSTLSCCNLKYGGDNANYYDYGFWYRHGGALAFFGSDASVSNTASSQNAGHGAYLSNGAHPTFNGVSFTDNDGYAIACADTESNPVLTGCSATSNGVNAIHIPGGTFSGSRTWYKSIPYHLVSHNWLAGDASLTIQPGVAVKKLGDTGLYIAGNLQAAGTAAEPIYFTSLKDDIYGDTNADGAASTPAPGDFREVDIYGAGTNPSRLSYCVFRYGGDGTSNYEEAAWHSAYGNIHIRNTTASLENCTFEHSANYGLYGTEGAQASIRNCTIRHNPWGIALGASAYYEGSTPLISGNTFTANTWGGYVSAQSFNQFDNSNNFAANTSNTIQIYGSTVQTASRWRRQTGAPALAVMGDIEVPGGTTLDVEAGNTVKVNSTVSLNCMGRFTADGTASGKILFTSFKDDTASGDSNADGTASDPAPGDWRSIVLFGDQNNTAVLRNCEFRYGGEGSNIYHGGFGWVYRHAGVVIYNCTPTLEDCALTKSGVFGLYVIGSSHPTLTRVKMDNNASWAAWQSIASNSHISNCSASGNGGNGILLEPGTISDARTWYRSVPYLLSGHTYVSPSATLTIEPGTVVKANPGVGFFVNGVVKAQADGGQPAIVFTSLKDDSAGGDTNADAQATTPAGGDWRHICFYGAPATPSVMTGCEFRYAGDSVRDYNGPGWTDAYGNVMVADCAPTFTQCTFSNSWNAGIYLAERCAPTLTRCIIRDNANWGLWLEDTYQTASATPPIQFCEITGNGTAASALFRSSVAFAANNSVHGNTHNSIEVRGGRLDINGRWPNMSGGTCAFVISGNSYLADGARLDVDAGVTVKFGTNMGLGVAGTLVTNGAERNRVNFTCYADDSFAGDTNADLSATSPAPGSYQGVLFFGNASGSRLRYTRFRYGGNGINDYDPWGFWNTKLGNVNVFSNVTPVFDHCEFAYSGYDGVYCESGDASFQSCTFAKNARMGLYSNGDSDNTLNSCILSDNPYAATQHNPEQGGSLAVLYSGLVGANYKRILVQQPNGQWEWEWQDLFPTGNGNIGDNPAFVSADSGDFHLLPSSPCINTGDPAQQDTDGSRLDMGAYPFLTTDSGDAHELPDGAFVKLIGRVVTAGVNQLGDRLYVEDPDRSSGIMVQTTTATDTGNAVTVVGEMDTIGGERAVVNCTVTPAGTLDVPKPLFMTGRSVGGGRLNSYTPGITYGVGLYNIGLLVRISGYVADTAPGVFWVDDGSFVSSEGGRTGVKVLSGRSVSPGQYVTVTGISGAFISGGKTYSVIRTRYTNDVTPLQ